METATSLFTNLFKGNGRESRCEVCGNEYKDCFEIRMQGETHTFDCFECAIHVLAPSCTNCGCRIIGHGLEADGAFYCCDHCARQYGVHNFEHEHTAERSKI
jgi:hypothetical protein